jgi:hypothetical protein
LDGTTSELVGAGALSLGQMHFSSWRHLGPGGGCTVRSAPIALAQDLREQMDVSSLIDRPPPGLSGLESKGGYTSVRRFPQVSEALPHGMHNAVICVQYVVPGAQRPLHYLTLRSYFDCPFQLFLYSLPVWLHYILPMPICSPVQTHNAPPAQHRDQGSATKRNIHHVLPVSL